MALLNVDYQDSKEYLPNVKQIHEQTETVRGNTKVLNSLRGVPEVQRQTKQIWLIKSSILIKVFWSLDRGSKDSGTAWLTLHSSYFKS